MSEELKPITGGMAFDVSGFTRGMFQVEAVSHMFPAIVTDFLAHPLLAVADVAKEAARWLKELFVGSMERADKIAREANTYGMTAQELSGLARAAEYADMSFEDVTDTVRFFNRAMMDVQKGNKEMTETFLKMGFTMDDVKAGIEHPIQGIYKLSDGFKALPEGAAKSAIAMDLLSRGGAKAVEFLSMGSEKIKEHTEAARRMGAVVSETAVKNAEKWQESTVALSQAWAGIKGQLAAPIAATVIPMLEHLREWVGTHPQQIQAMVQTMVQGITRALSLIGSAIQFVVTHGETFMKLLGAAVMGKIVMGAVGMLGDLAGAFMRAGAAAEVAAGQAAVAGAGFQASMSRMAMGGGIGAGIGAMNGGGTGAMIGGGIGGIAGGMIGQALIPIPGLGFVVGSALGGLLGSQIGKQFDDEPAKPTINFNNPSFNVDPTQAGEDIAREVSGKLRQGQRTYDARSQSRSIEVNL